MVPSAGYLHHRLEWYDQFFLFRQGNVGDVPIDDGILSNALNRFVFCVYVLANERWAVQLDRIRQQFLEFSICLS